MKYSFYVTVYRRITSDKALNKGALVPFFSTQPTHLAYLAQEALCDLRNFFTGENYKVVGVTEIVNTTTIETDIFHLPETVQTNELDY